MAEVWYDGTTWIARKRGFPGKVFGDSRDQALGRISAWTWMHERPEIFQPPRKRNKKG